MGKQTLNSTIGGKRNPITVTTIAAHFFLSSAHSIQENEEYNLAVYSKN